MKELITVEKGKWESLQRIERENKELQRRISELHTRYRDLERRHFELITTKAVADNILKLGDYAETVDTNV